ncbi:juvenile hormone epoxide hydrolase-like [Galleria mellonella]|uniref:Epoxide hydrolase n=1 Tax=Galleria mellonella TaxID=7137 RepID=A0A6J1WNE6_GALME|nr:juvenile hormone epoxide hydrolase-like [Galleria mellonella]XP_052758074.1 juvenile hormone epoxide hydrolase-like [Galleria mellonella]
MLKALLLILLVIIAFPVYIFFIESPSPLPDLDYNAWWGPEHLRQKQDTSVRPFRINFTEPMINDLRSRLRNHRAFTPPLEGIGFQYGFNSKALDPWIRYWAEEYPFREREKYINKFPQFKTNIQGLDIHFLRIKPQVSGNVEVVPLLLVHGWPSSVLEFYSVIPLLTAVNKGKDFVFELIIPSIPGYGYSDAAVRPGLGAIEVAVVFRNLMHRLGHKRFYIQGGDWGAVICSNMATLFPNEVLGHHTNLGVQRDLKSILAEFLIAIYPSLFVDSELVERLYPLSKSLSFLIEESGYFHIQATKPDTIGVALTDSPVGLLAYNLEKVSVATRAHNRELEDGGLTKYFTREHLIDNLMFYWATNSVTSSMRLYAESVCKKQLSMKVIEHPTPVPTWVIQAKYEISYQPPIILRLKYPNLVNVTVLHDGGHFLATELPRVFADDLFTAVQSFRNFNRNIKTEL